jgi:hypothetical protein
MSRDMTDSSPVSDECLLQAHVTLKRHLKIGGSRIPEQLRHVLETLISNLHSELDCRTVRFTERITMMREFERLDNELRGRTALAPQLYSDGMLGIIQAWDPITIRECIDYRWVSEHMVRYEERTQRALKRLSWFLKRCGVGEEEELELKPWQLPYAHLDESKELLWGKIKRSS